MRPKLTDPEEFALIREIYFEPATFKNSDIEPIELLERIESRKTLNQAK